MYFSEIGDPLIVDEVDHPAFDRFYFNLHDSGGDLLLVLGAGIYPPVQRVDGYVVIAAGGQQRNLRLADHLAPTRPLHVGPLRWEVVVPYREWRLALAPNATGVDFDLTWRSRAAPYTTDQYEVTDEDGASSHAHFFQSGTYTGLLRVDGDEIDVSGYHGQRDRSRGNRRVSDGLGMHLWLQAQFDEASLGFLFNMDRDGRPTHCSGALMREDGTADNVIDVHHELTFDHGLEFIGGRIEVQFARAQAMTVSITPTRRGIYMAGAGVGGWHGRDHGPDHVEHERWSLDGSLAPRNLESSLCQVLAAFDADHERGIGVLEYGVTRSPSYTYKPTMHRESP